MASGNLSWRNLEGVSQSMRSNRGSSIVCFSDRHTFGASLEHISVSHRRQEYKTQVRVAADYPDSKPDASSYLGDFGYHPLEDISNLEKKKSIDVTDRRLSNAEVARTLAEANETAILFASLLEDRDHVFGTEVEYLIDKHGDFYFQIDDDSEFMTTLNSARTQMNVAIGYESIDDWILEQQEIHEESTPEEPSNDDSSDESEDEHEESWAILTADGTEYVLEEVIGEQESPEESIGNWSGLDTLESVHPLEFARALATAAMTDDNEEIDKPTQSLKIVGEVRRLNEEEEEYVKKLCEERFGSEEDEDEDEDEDDEKDEDEETDETSTENTEETGSEDDEDEEGQASETGISFYKLEIQNILVVSYFRAESTVEAPEFRGAKPDILARAGPEIIERLNAGGKVLEDALKLVCLHRKGLEVEEAALLHLDCLGMDLRVHCGRELKTLRISFSQRATSVEHAEQLLNQLLFPEVPPKGRRKRKSWFQGKST